MFILNLSHKVDFSETGLFFCGRFFQIYKSSLDVYYAYQTNPHKLINLRSTKEVIPNSKLLANSSHIRLHRKHPLHTGKLYVLAMTKIGKPWWVSDAVLFGH